MGKGRRKSESAMLKVAVVNPIPKAMDRTAIAVAPGLLPRTRQATRKSCLREAAAVIVLLY
jgi:hypothetical protein